MRHLILLFAFSGALTAFAARTALDFVDPFIGTEGAGSQYGGMQPYVTVPFGSIHTVPQTRRNGVGRLSFNSADTNLLGIVLTRQPAIWMGDWGWVEVPVPQPCPIESVASRPERTVVKAGGRTIEWTTTEHAVWIRGDLDGVTLEDGVNRNRQDERLGYPLEHFASWHIVDRPDARNLRIGVSLLSSEQARKNLAAEIPAGATFESVAAATRAKWAQAFSRLEIDAPDEVKTIFYTGLFHALLYPRRLDEDGRYYSAFDDRVHALKPGMKGYYNCFSLWDTYRAEHPLLTLIQPDRVADMMNSLLAMYEEGGWLPKWPNPGYTGIMVGSPAEVVLAEACAKGFPGVDWNLAYAAAKKNATVPQANDRTFAWEDRGCFGRTPETRGGLSRYMELGYVVGDETAESVSRTQDFCLDDCATAVLAEAIGHSDEAAYFRRRAKSYTNLWQAAKGEFRPRSANGDFLDWNAGPTVGGCIRSSYCEQSPQTAVWGLPFDTDGLAALLGGKAAATRRLDDFFDRMFWSPEHGNKSIHGNEPSHHCAYLYNRFGHPEKTQRRVREIMTRAYSTNRKGFDGNEDCGQMSAWYIFSALGFYPLDPARAEYELGSPIVRGARLRFGAPYKPSTLEIKVENYHPDRWRVRRVTLNGVEITSGCIRHADLVKGGVLIFEMDDRK